MNYRKLRIVWSVGCGILCLLLLALWVRSQYWQDRVIRRGNAEVEFRSYHGLIITWVAPITDPIPAPAEWEFKTRISDHKWYVVDQAHPQLASLGFKLGRKSGARYLFLPHWFLVLSTATLAVVPWIKWCFSLRTLLIGMTLVAVVLGLVVFAKER